MKKYKLLSCSFYGQVCGGWFPHWGLHIRFCLTRPSVIPQQLPSLATPGWIVQLSPQLSVELVSAQFGPDPHLPRSSQCFINYLCGLWVRPCAPSWANSAAVCSIVAAWRHSGHRIQMNGLQFAFLLSLVLLLLLLHLFCRLIHPVVFVTIYQFPSFPSEGNQQEVRVIWTLTEMESRSSLVVFLLLMCPINSHCPFSYPGRYFWITFLILFYYCDNFSI